MTSAREHEQPVSAPPPSLIVLNNDAIVCDACYKPQALELDPGLIPSACIASGECSRCGAGSAAPPPGARATSSTSGPASARVRG